jgi:hypothetical protein
MTGLFFVGWRGALDPPFADSEWGTQEGALLPHPRLHLNPNVLYFFNPAPQFAINVNGVAVFIGNELIKNLPSRFTSY